MAGSRRRGIALAAIAAILIGAGTLQDEKGPSLIHTVYFTLHERTPESADALVTACRKYLKGHEGELSFQVGKRSPQSVRTVNDLDFDVSISIVFKTRADHDRYQTHARHKQFITEFEPTWARVRVFDSDLVAE